MYNDIIIIIMCVFAVYGGYALLREISMVFSRKKRIVAAVRVDNKEFDDVIVLTEQRIATHVFFERQPVLLCDKDIPKDLQKYGYEIYIKQTEEK